MDCEGAQHYVKRHEKYCVQMPGFVPLVAVETKGSILKDIEGREYIDFVSQTSGSASVGSGHPKVVDAIKTQADRMLHNSAWLINIPKVELSEKLARITPPLLCLCWGQPPPWLSWPQDHINKGSALQYVLEEKYPSVNADNVITIGDSSSDGPLFEHFPISVGVANIAEYEEELGENLPLFIASRREGYGVVEVLDRILEFHGEKARS